MGAMFAFYSRVKAVPNISRYGVTPLCRTQHTAYIGKPCSEKIFAMTIACHDGLTLSNRNFFSNFTHDFSVAIGDID